MLKKPLALLFSALMLASLCKAQTEKKNIIKVNFLSPIASTLSLFYERKVSKSLSLQLGLAYTGASVTGTSSITFNSNTITETSKTSINGFYVTPELRYYLSDKDAPQGFFIAPYLRYQNFGLSTKYTGTQSGIPESKATFSSFGGGVLIGGQWIFKDRISLDVWGGPSYNNANFKVTAGDKDDFILGNLGISNFGLRFGATVGVAF